MQRERCAPAAGLSIRGLRNGQGHARAAGDEARRARDGGGKVKHALLEGVLPAPPHGGHLPAELAAAAAAATAKL